MAAESVNKRSKRLIWWLGGLVSLYGLLGFMLVPAIAKGQLAPFVQERFGLAGSVGRIELNPFTFTASIADLDFIDESGERVLALDSARVNLQFAQLLRGAISLRELTLNGLHIGVHRYADGSINLARIAERFAASVPPASVEAAADTAVREEGLAFSVEITQLRIADASVGVIDEVPVIPFMTFVESINFTLNDLSTVPQAIADQYFTLALGDGSQLRWRGDLSLAPISSSGELQLSGPITDMAYRYFQSQIPVKLVGAWFDSTLNYELAIRDDGAFDVQFRDLQASLRDLDILTREDGERLALLPDIVVTGGEFSLLDKRIKLTRVQLDDFEILPLRFADGRINFLEILPAIQPQDAVLVSAAQGEPWDIEVTELVVERWQISARDEMPVQGANVTLDFAARATNITNRANSPINIDTNIVLRSGGVLRAGGALTAQPTLSFDGEFALDEFSLPVLQPYLEDVANIGLESGSFALSGDVRVTASQSEFNGIMSLDDLAITDRIQNEALFGITALQVDSADISLGESRAVEIGAVHIRQPYARIEIEADGSSNIGRVLVRSDSGEAAATTTEPAQGEGIMAIMLKSIVIEQASVDFSDSSLPLPFAVHMDALGGSISALSTQSLEPARVDLEGQVDDYGQVTIDGRLRPLDYASLTEIDLFFRNLDIPSLSPYVIKFAGRRIAEGDLDVDLSYRINDGQLDGANSMVMRDLVLGERVPHPDALDLPLGLAIALLKDRNGVIDLDVPVTGELNNPQFSFGSVISRALANIISNIVSSPFRFLANLVGDGDEDAGIGTIEFAPGRADIMPPEREKLAKLGLAMLARPQLQLGLAEVYVANADRSALQERFFDSRLDAALEAASLEPDAPQSPSALRMRVLEELYQESAQDSAQLIAAQAFLVELQQRQGQSGVVQQAQLDTLAYSEALRRELIERESVTEVDLVQLGGQRADSIEEELIRIDVQLEQRLKREDKAVAVQLSQGRVPMALSLSALEN